MELSKFGWALFLFSTSIFTGMVGYMTIEEMSIIDSLYMTIITLSTVGFKEVAELSNPGKIFTSMFILFNLCVYAYTVTIMTTYLIEGELKNKFEEFKHKKTIQKMKDHVIICGFGRNGSKATEELLKNRVPLVIIDADENKHKASNAIKLLQAYN